MEDITLMLRAVCRRLYCVILVRYQDPKSSLSALQEAPTAYPNENRPAEQNGRGLKASEELLSLQAPRAGAAFATGFSYQAALRLAPRRAV